MSESAALDVLDPIDVTPRRVRMRHGIASPTDLVLNAMQADRLSGCLTLGEALETLLSTPGIDPRFADACRKTLAGPCVVELLAPSGPSVGTPRTPTDGRLASFPMEIGFSRAVRGGAQ